MFTHTRIARRLGLCIFAATLILLVSLSCSSDPAPTGSGGGGTTGVVLSLNGTASNLQVLANQTNHLHVTYQVPPSIGSIQAVDIDVAASAQYVSYAVTLTPSTLLGTLSSLWNKGLDSTVQATVRVGNDAATVCASGFIYGPTTISAASLLSPTPHVASLDTSSVRILNAGTMVICLEILSTVGASFSIESFEATVTQGDCDAPADFAGEWRGTYQCDNACGGITGDTIVITLNQDGTTASYTDDGGASYTGTVCGNVFRFSGGGPGYTENGTLTLETSGMALKRSSYRDSLSPFCMGDCLDSLFRMSATVAINN